MKHSITTAWSAGLVSALLAGLLAGCASQRPATGDEGEVRQTAAVQREAAAFDMSRFALYDLEESTWRDPPEIESANGRLVANLAVEIGEFDNPYPRNTPQGRPAKLELRSYRDRASGTPNLIVGPTLRFKAGDQLFVNLANELASSNDVADKTNFHTHGLHISPGCHPMNDPACRIASDNVLLDIGPDQFQNFRFDILPAGSTDPWKHYPGTFWYHAHRHGSTSVQVASGMAGALILEDPAEMAYMKLTRAQERLFILQQIAFDATGQVKSVADLRNNWKGKSTTINGVLKPFFTMRPGEVERWRLVGAGIFETINFGLVRPDKDDPQAPALHLIAIDGITLKQRRVVDRYELGPGYRADLVVKAPDQPGVYQLVKDKATMMLGFGETTDTMSVLAELRVDGRHCREGGCRGTELPPVDLRPFHPMKDITQIDGQRREIEFSVQNGKFLINGCEYAMNRVDQAMVLNRKEEWKLSSKTGNHPFHIHVNAFQMVDADDNLGDWHDTIIAPAAPGVKMRTHYERFTGKFVLHCHILDHEDKGMMQLVEIVTSPARNSPCTYP